MRRERGGRRTEQEGRTTSVGRSSPAPRASASASSSALRKARSAPACGPPPVTLLCTLGSMGSASRPTFEPSRLSFSTSSSAFSCCGSASASSKSSSWQAESTSPGARFARIATLAGCHREVANNSPEPRHRPRKPLRDLESLHREDGAPTRRQRLPRRAQGRSLIHELGHNPGHRAAPLFTPIAGETQMHHRCGPAQTMTRRRRLVRLPTSGLGPRGAPISRASK